MLVVRFIVWLTRLGCGGISSCFYCGLIVWLNPSLVDLWLVICSRASDKRKGSLISQAPRLLFIQSGFNPLLDTKRVQERFPLFFGVTPELLPHGIDSAVVATMEYFMTHSRLILGSAHLAHPKVYSVVFGLRQLAALEEC